MQCEEEIIKGNLHYSTLEDKYFPLPYVFKSVKNRCFVCLLEQLLKKLCKFSNFSFYKQNQNLQNACLWAFVQIFDKIY